MYLLATSNYFSNFLNPAISTFCEMTSFGLMPQCWGCTLCAKC
ncbi:hypothetical protein VCHA48O428_10615 [Vibrio chagasii]|nr:hypothetical protein VCHA34P131_170053 [Vibrio chagasii]CAH6824775.1 hypothetical protein VCHA34P121_160053 [Vibrio chagasii]CAH6879437.1 hypothetical protein VCHA29O39_20038 [Vibrio chagasii]CAH6950653.1 hypothetical protein VCHA48P439_150095 [Vibrio chagasii]CAH7023146.1 hypothetical protein VCHA35O143_50041 [Vibrio chagasii]